MTIPRIPTGIPRLDEMMHGGLLPRSATLVRGAPGVGKTTLAFNFLQHGANERGENGLLVTFEEFPRSLYRDARSVGLDLKALEASERLTIQFTSPETLLRNLQTAGSPLSDKLHERNIRRVVIDGATHFARLTDDEHELRNYYVTLVNALKREEVTALLLGEETHASAHVAERGRLAFIVDCILLLRYLEIDSAIRRAILVLKLRGSAHAKHIHSFEIGPNGMQVGEPFRNRQGLLSGLARLSMISTVRYGSQ